MGIKKGAKINGLKSEMILAFIIAQTIYYDYNIPCILTEGTGGDHGIASLHYVGFAIDLRTRDMSKSTAEIIVEQIKKALGDQYDVILEKDHIHIEFQPK